MSKKKERIDVIPPWNYCEIIDKKYCFVNKEREVLKCFDTAEECILYAELNIELVNSKNNQLNLNF